MSQKQTTTSSKAILNIFNLQLKLNFTSQDIDFARRLGKKENNKLRPIYFHLYFRKKSLKSFRIKKD